LKIFRIEEALFLRHDQREKARRGAGVSKDYLLSVDDAHPQRQEADQDGDQFCVHRLHGRLKISP
jgi:hypothetical protein